MSWISRRVAAILLGLPVAVFAHVAIFGHEHVIAGAHHNDVMDAALTVVAMLATLLALGSFLGSRRVADGSILAARMTAHLPSWPLAITSLGWFALLEHFENRSPSVAGMFVVALVALAVMLGLRAFAKMLARVTLALFTDPVVARRSRIIFANREPQLLLRTRLSTTRRFARPPPAFL